MYYTNFQNNVFWLAGSWSYDTSKLPIVIREVMSLDVIKNKNNYKKKKRTHTNKYNMGFVSFFKK